MVGLISSLTVLLGKSPQSRHSSLDLDRKEKRELEHLYEETTDLNKGLKVSEFLNLHHHNCLGAFLFFFHTVLFYCQKTKTGG